MSQVRSKHSPSRQSWRQRVSHLFKNKQPQNTDELITFLEDAKQRHLIDSEALAMIEGVLQVSELQVRDIMIPRAHMVVTPADANLKTIFPLVIESAHSRFPVIGEDRSDVIGILLAKDLLKHCRHAQNQLVSDVLRPVHFVPESKRLNILLKEFRSNRSHMAIVVDEYGASAGLVTIEDVLEQIVGDIEDEHDFEDADYVYQRSIRSFTVKALMPIDEFNDYFASDLDKKEFDTLGGLIAHTLGHVPKRGEIVELQGFRFSILRADNRRAHLLKLLIPDSETETETIELYPEE